MARRRSVKTTKLSDEDKESFMTLTTKPYMEQAKWFLNAFWRDTFEGHPSECENVWKRAHQFIELDDNKGSGCQLDEFRSHKFLEQLGETLTVLELREKLRNIDIDMNGMMALSEYLLFRYNKEVEYLVRPQADPAEIKQAQEMVQQAQQAQAEMQRKLDDQQRKLEEQQEALREVQAAEAEQKHALDDLRRQEEEYKNKIQSLEQKSQTGGVVSRNKAAAELAQAKAEDPLPLRRAKITQEASVRRVEKARKVAEQAEQAAQEAKAAAEKSVEEAERIFQLALDKLEDVKSRAGSSEGTVWWLQREMDEMKKYRPGYKAKPTA